MIDVNRLPLEEKGGLIDLLKTITDPRKPRGVRHPVVGNRNFKGDGWRIGKVSKRPPDVNHPSQRSENEEGMV